MRVIKNSLAKERKKECRQNIYERHGGALPLGKDKHRTMWQEQCTLRDRWIYFWGFYLGSPGARLGLFEYSRVELTSFALRKA
jgi:hypothetical protein